MTAHAEDPAPRPPRRPRGALVVAVAGVAAAAGVACCLLPRDVGRPAPPVDVVLAVDSSGSMRALYPAADGRDARRDAVEGMARRLGAAARVAVIDFDDTSRVVAGLTPVGDAAGRGAVAAAIDRLAAGGGTDLDAAVRLAVSELEAAPRRDARRHLVLLTDGIGELRPATRALLDRHCVRVSCVGLGPGADAERLRALAASTGGRYYPAPAADDVVAALLDLANDLANDLATL